MMMFDDNNAFIQGNGRLTLGFGGYDDGAYDPTHQYAKSDVYWAIPPSWLQVAGGPTSAFAAPTMASRQTLQSGGGGVSMAVSLDSGKSGSQFVLIPFPFFQRTTTILSQNNATYPHGFKLKKLQMQYAVLNSALGTAPVLTAWTETPANLTTRTNAVYDSAQITFESPPGSAVTTLPVAVNSAGFLVSYNFTNPAFVTTANQVLWAELQFAMIGSTTTAVALLSNIVAVMSLALY